MSHSPLRPFTDEDAANWPDGALITFCAPSGGGKSVCLQWLLSLPSMISRFSAAVVVSPTSTFKCHKETDEPNQFRCVGRPWHYDLSTYTLEEIIQKVTKTQMRLQAEGRAGEVLLILDDIFTSVSCAAHNNSVFNSFISLRRHARIFCAAIMQGPRNIAPSVRSQISGVFFSRPQTYEDRKRVAEWYLSRTSRGSKRDTMAYAYQILDETFTHDYAFLYVENFSKSTEPREYVRIAIAPGGGKIKKFKLKFKKPRRGRKAKDRQGGTKGPKIKNGTGFGKGHLNGLQAPDQTAIHMRIEDDETESDEDNLQTSYFNIG